MRKLLITWQDPNGFPRQHLTPECDNLMDLLQLLQDYGIRTEAVVNLRPAYFGDAKEFPVLGDDAVKA